MTTMAIEEDAAVAPLNDDDDEHDDRGVASEDRDDDIVPFGKRVVQVLAIRDPCKLSCLCYQWLRLGTGTWPVHLQEALGGRSATMVRYFHALTDYFIRVRKHQHWP